MTRIFRLLAAAAVFTGMAFTAQAADNDYISATPPVYSWQGFYAGVQLGGGKFHVSNGNSDTAAVGGVHAGYLWQNGQFVFGPEFDVDAAGWTIGSTHVDAEMNAKFRAGFAVDRALFTGTIGYGHTWASNGGSKGDDGGLVAGAGIDFAATDRVIVGADYLYHHIDTFNPGTVDTDSHTVRARLSFKFN
jgi:opacity protein-like surface antigen